MPILPGVIFYHFHSHHALLPSPEAEHFVHLQPTWYLVGDEQHGNPTLELEESA
jgi:hypothetical protein